MIVSWNWLTQYVRLDVPVEVLVDRLALAGLNHEATVEVEGDLAIELEVTSNRSDCLSHLGVAREVAALFGHPLREPDPRPPETGTPVETMTAVQVDEPELCPRFTARVVSGARIGESPWWLRQRLKTLGVRSINNVVDITNYVLFECGQPLHTYDWNLLAEKRLVVRRARPGEALMAINGRIYDLAPEMLVIADARRPVGLAGVMGGLETEIGAQTTDILIESAQFDPMTVRRTARALNLHSPSSYRFERPMDPERTEWASRRCASLILELAGGTLHPGVIDIVRAGLGPSRRPTIRLRFDQLPRLLGIEVPRTRACQILVNLGLEPVVVEDGSAEFRPPSWRSDLEREIDLIEEVARVHGYEHIPEDRPVPLTTAARSARERVEDAVREVLTGLGFDEAVTLSLVPEELVAPLEPAPSPAPLRVEHSSRKRESALRQSLVPSLLAARAYNEAHANPHAALFEIADVYLPRDGQVLPDQPTRLGLVGGPDFFSLKGVVEAVLARLHLEGELDARPASCPLFAPGRTTELRLGEAHLGYLGEVDETRRETLGLRDACLAAELSLDVLVDRARLIPTYHPLPPFPAMARDLSLVVPHDLSWAALADVVRTAGGPWLESLTYLDTFRGGNIPDGWQSVHFGLRFRHPDRTLTGEEADVAVQAIVNACASHFGARLRG